MMTTNLSYHLSPEHLGTLDGGHVGYVPRSMAWHGDVGQGGHEPEQWDMVDKL